MYLAQPQLMVRIATGRDVAKAAFLDNRKGAITLQHMQVTVIVDRIFSHDSVHELVSSG
jgi:hypothetical protein